jgi:hypothetical protein
MKKYQLEYWAWKRMRGRCLCPTNTAFHNYGGRGIKICKRWDKFENFLKDMGLKPKRHSLERINNMKGYSPLNCHWANVTEQNRNRRCVKLSIDDARSIRGLHKEGIDRKTIAKCFDVSLVTLHLIIHGKIWMEDVIG